MSQQMDNAQRAQVLVHALPYIQKYANKIIVVKYGGNAMLNEELKSAVMNDIVLLSLIGIRVVLVHGGGPEITETLKAMGKTSTFVEGRRVTDEETAGVVQMVLAGKINKSLVNRIGAIGGKAIGPLRPGRQDDPGRGPGYGPVGLCGQHHPGGPPAGAGRAGYGLYPGGGHGGLR